MERRQQREELAAQEEVINTHHPFRSRKSVSSGNTSKEVMRTDYWLGYSCFESRVSIPMRVRECVLAA